MNKKLIFAFLCLCWSFSYGQSDTVKYTVLLDNPNSIPKTSITLAPACLSFSVSNILTAGIEVGVSTNIKRLKLQTSFSRPYSTKAFDLNAFLSKTNQSNNSKQDFKSAYDFEIGGGFILSDITAEKRVMINLASQQTGTIILNTITEIPMKVRKRIVLNFGFLKYTNVSAIRKDFNSQSGDLFSTDGIKYHNINYSSISSYADKTVLPTDNWLTNVYCNVFKIGIEKEFINNSIISTTRFGKKVFRSSFKTYADFLIGNVKVDDILFYDSNPNAKKINETIGTNLIYYKPQFGNGENKLRISNLGFRLGISSQGLFPSKYTKWENRDGTSKLISGGVKFEVGLMPGIGMNFYGKFSVFMVLNH